LEGNKVTPMKLTAVALIVTLALTILAAPLTAEAQPAGRVEPIGSPTAPADEPAADWRASFQEGVRAIEEDRLSDAIGHLQRAIEVNPDAREPYAAIRIAYGLRGRDVGEVGVERGLLRVARDHLERDELDKAERVLELLLQHNFANPEPHLMLQALHAKRGRSAAIDHAGKIFRGLLEALLATGDGKTPETAFLVLGIAEEYLLVGYVFRCRTLEQRVHFPPSGGVYDVLKVLCADAERTVYFDVSAWGPDPAWRLKTYRPAPPKSP
jgi:tetratricopeptide (TPR) repeat protein